MISEKIQDIERKVRQLAGQLESLQQANAQLKKQNQQLTDDLRRKQSQNGELEDKLAKAQQGVSAQQAADPARNKRLRKEIDQHIKEVDKCIEWLQNN